MKFSPIHGLLTGVLLLGAGARLSAQPAPPATVAPAGPQLTFATKDYDFGRVTAGTLVKYTYIATNTGGQTLEITAVKPGCHCTTAGDWTHRIEPGHTGVIPVQFDSANFNGSLSRVITVTSTDKLAPMQTLSLHGTVWRPIEVNPQFAYINVRPGAESNATCVVHITSQADEPVTLSEPVSATAAFKASLKTVIPGKEFELTVTAVPPLPAGNLVGRISVKTSLTNMPELTITTMAVLQQTVTVSPTEIMLPPTTAGMTNIITIQNHLAKPLTLSDPEICCDSRASVRLKTIMPGQIYQLAVSFPPGFSTGTNQAGVINVKTDYAGQPVITVPVRSRVLPLPPGIARHL